VTYPAKEVQNLLNDEFVPVRVPFETSREMKDRFDVVWTPTLVLVDGAGKGHQKLVPASLAPEEFIAVLLTSLGRSLLSLRRYGDAITRFDRALRGRAHRIAAPEALYWRGVAQYKAGDKEAMQRSWGEVASHPDSYWAKAIAWTADRK
jgi:hypothetical protein